MTLEEFLGEQPVDQAHLPIGEILLRRGQVRRYQLSFALKLQKSYKNNARKEIQIGELLVKHRAVNPNSLADALILQRELPAESITQIVSKLDLDDVESEETKLLPSDQ